MTVNGVSNGDSFLAAIRSSPSSSQRSGVSDEADQPAPLLGHEVDRLGRRELGGERQVALVLAVLVVARRRPSCPGGSSSIASSIVANGVRRLVAEASLHSVRLQQPLDVLGEHVDLEVDGRARGHRAEVRALERLRDQRHLEAVARTGALTVRLTPSTATEPFSTR